MAVVGIDSNVLIAMASKRDTNHEAGRAIVEGMDDGDLPTARVSNYVVAEVLNFIHERHTHAFALDTYRRVEGSAGFEVVHAPKTDYTTAVDLFETYEGLSFVDATITAYLQREEVEYLYSFDDDFDALDDVTRLATAINPFE
jgi:predicted nucleic acid-binding protein